MAPVALCAATLPSNGSGGFIDISNLSWYDLHLRPLLWAIVVILAVAVPATTLIWLHDDHELLFGCLTIFTALAGVAVFTSVLLRRRVEDQAGSTFAWLAAVSVLLLTLIAHDWVRRHLTISALIVAAALSVFIVRVGYESLKVPPQWERAQIAGRAQADENALKTQYKGEKSDRINSFKTARATLTAIRAATHAPSVSQPLLDDVDQILNYAYEKKISAVDSEAFDAFDEQFDNESVASAAAVRGKLADAVHALQTAESAAVTPISSTLLDRAIGKVGTHDPGAITTNRDWVSDKHELDIQLATFRANVTGADADRAALKAVLAQQPEVDDDISILAAIQNGPETLWRSTAHSPGPALVPGPLGWVIMGALLLGLLAWLLKVNASQLAGPVSVMPKNPDGTDSGQPAGDDQLVTVLRVAVLQNVDEPGAAPGAPSANPVTNLLDIAGGPLSSVSKVVQTVLTVVGKRHGYVVTMDVTTSDPGVSSSPPGPHKLTSKTKKNQPGASGRPPSPGAATKGTATTPASASTTVLIRVMSISGGVTLASHLCTSPRDEDAVRTAGFWAAGYILNRSTRIPGWAAWQADTAQALVLTKNSSYQSIAILETALQAAPNSGILLVLLGHHHELVGKTENAISYYARAVTAYPRYVVARYRLAAALATMRHRTNWFEKNEADRADILRGVEAALTTLEMDNWGRDVLKRLLAPTPPPDKTTGSSSQDAGKASGRNSADDFQELALLLLRDLEVDTWRLFRLVCALRRSERDSIWPSLPLGSTHPAARFQWLVKSARLALGDDKSQLDELTEKANEPNSWWQISYNAACAYASKVPDNAAPEGKRIPGDDAEAAFKFLERTLVSPGIHQLSSDWVNTDPDLKRLKNDPRFTWYAKQLRRDPQGPAGPP